MLWTGPGHVVRVGLHELCSGDGGYLFRVPALPRASIRTVTVHAKTHGIRDLAPRAISGKMRGVAHHGAPMPDSRAAPDELSNIEKRTYWRSGGSGSQPGSFRRWPDL